MSKIVDYFKYDDAGWFDGNVAVQILDDGTTISPTRCTPVAPADDPEGKYFFKWTGQTWEQIEKPTALSQLAGVTVPHDSQKSHDVEMREIIKSLEGTDPNYRIARGENLSWIVEKVPDPTIEQVKEDKLKELDSFFMKWYERDATVTSSLGFVADSDSRAIMDVSGLVTALEAQPVETRGTVGFMDHENSPHLLTLDQLKTVRLEIIKNGQSAYAQKWAYRSAIENAESVEALQAMSFTFTGEDFSHAAS